eukprot:c18825_g1_i1 orf=166-1443(+)
MKIDTEMRVEHRIDIRSAGEIQEIPTDSRESLAFSDHQPLLTNLTDNGQAALPPSRQASFSGSIVADTFVCARFVFVLITYLGIGYRWMINMSALFFYGCFILPGVMQVGWRYFSDKRIHRGIPYGPDPRNKLDLYLPDNLDTPRPVVAFVSGGAWIIGYKAWGSLLALQLVEEGVIVACMDYRNFPQGTISDMVEDVSQGISFICNNIATYGGDLDRLYLVGQSAGAHLGACTLLNQAKKECEGNIVYTSSQERAMEEALLTWRASQFKAYIGISGGYDLKKLADHFHAKGMNRSLFFSIMEGEESLATYSPELCVQDGVNVGSFLPPINLLHGTDDDSIPCDASTSFAAALTSAGVQATTRLYEGKSHTDLFLQDPMRGGYNALLEDILVILNLAEEKDVSTRLQRRMVPEFLLRLAHRISPF